MFVRTFLYNSIFNQILSFQRILNTFTFVSMVSNKKETTIRLSLRCENWINSNPYEGIAKIYESTSKKEKLNKRILKKTHTKVEWKSFFKKKKWIYQGDIKTIQERLDIDYRKN